MKKWFAGIFSWSSNFLNTVYWICQSKNDQKCEQNSREWQSMKFEYLELVHHGDSSEILSHLYTKWYASMYSFSMTTRVEHIIAQQTECRIVSNKLIWTNTFLVEYALGCNCIINTFSNQICFARYLSHTWYKLYFDINFNFTE